ncbi:MAG: hypothetical protein JSU72_20165 [Deltaproteobacteria bacterium]|nr:MAG: hypothetical protein JSU72_20165 [Deltaproteobacteria bacterium]
MRRTRRSLPLRQPDRELAKSVRGDRPPPSSHSDTNKERKIMAPETESLSHRLEKVERENRRIKLVGVVVVMLMATLLLTGLSVEDPVIGAEAFTLVDGQGEMRAVFAMVNDEPTLALFDSEGKVRAGIMVAENSPRLILYAEDGKTPIWSAP